MLVMNAAIPFIVPVGRSNPSARVLTIFLGTGAWFIWVAVSIEGLFYVAFALMLYIWVEVECVWRAALPSGSGPSAGSKASVIYQPRAEDLRIAIFFLFFIQVAYFGPGKSVFRICYILILIYCIAVFPPSRKRNVHGRSKQRLITPRSLQLFLPRTHLPSRFQVQPISCVVTPSKWSAF